MITREVDFSVSPVPRRLSAFLRGALRTLPEYPTYPPNTGSIRTAPERQYCWSQSRKAFIQKLQRPRVSEPTKTGPTCTLKTISTAIRKTFPTHSFGGVSGMNWTIYFRTGASPTRTKSKTLPVKVGL